jgi:hypothetical protein
MLERNHRLGGVGSKKQLLAVASSALLHAAVLLRARLDAMPARNYASFSSGMTSFRPRGHPPEARHPGYPHPTPARPTICRWRPELEANSDALPALDRTPLSTPTSAETDRHRHLEVQLATADCGPPTHELQLHRTGRPVGTR